MRKRFYIFGILIIAVGLGFVFSRSYQAVALDAPHNLENTLARPLNDSPCTSTCHSIHNAQGSQLNQQSGNVSLCVHCHTTGNTFVLPGSNPTVPGVVGIHHQYNVPYNNLGASSPATMFPGAHVLENNNIICSSCHDVHVATTNWGTQKVYPIAKVAGGGTGTVTLGSPLAANAAAKAYRIKILVGGTVPTATFILSNDGGLSWWYWAAGAWTTTPGDGKPTGTNIDLNDGTNVKVTFTGNFSSGPPADEFQFYVSYPFLRRALDYGPNGAQNPPTTNNLCRGCHSNRVNTYTQVEGPGDGTTKFSHPVGQKLNANSRGYDRATPLDANGAPQTSPPSADVDGNPSNDIRLDYSDSLNPKVQCYSCHNIHYGDSNSLSTDSPM